MFEVITSSAKNYMHVCQENIWDLFNGFSMQLVIFAANILQPLLLLHLKEIPYWLQLLAMLVTAWHNNTHIHFSLCWLVGSLWERGEEDWKKRRAKDTREKNFITFFCPYL